MTRIPYILFVPAAGDWQIGSKTDAGVTLSVVPGTLDVPPEQAVRAIRLVLDQRGYRDEAVLLAIPSQWCLCAGLSVSDLPRKNRRSLMLYRFEECLPVPAEELVVDFITGPDQALGVAVRGEQLSPLIEALERSGITISHVCPLALLALQAAKCNDLDVVICQSGEHAVDIIRLKTERPVAWHLLGSGDEEIVEELHSNAMHTEGALRFGALGVNATLTQKLNEVLGIPAIVADDRALLNVAIEGANSVLCGKTAPWVNLRRDTLACVDPLRQVRSALNGAIAATILFSLCVAGAMIWQVQKYQRLGDKLHREQETMFREALPGQSIPANVKSRLESEERKLRGVSGEPAQLPEYASALAMMYQTMANLPRTLRFRLLDLRFTGTQIYLEGQVRSHGDAESIAVALRRIDSLLVDEPQSEQHADQSITFALSASARVGKVPNGRTSP